MTDIFRPTFGEIEDGFGNSWPLCKRDCALEIVRPGKVQCDLCDSADDEIYCMRCGSSQTIEHECPRDKGDPT